MWNKFKGWPLSVRIAIVFLTATITSVVVMVPAVMIPLLLILATVMSVLRVAIYFAHGE
jgi:hypothetical protein